MDAPHLLALDRAAKKAGGIGKLAAGIGVGQSVVSNWKARGTLIDALYCVEIERLTEGEVSRRDLRPDDWQRIWPELAMADAMDSAPAPLS